MVKVYRKTHRPKARGLRLRAPRTGPNQFAERLPAEPEQPPESRKPSIRERGSASRLVSLDAFRGLTILGMLLVNNAALDTFTPKHLTHAGWNQGVYMADLVFPWFLLIVGVAIPYAAAAHLRKGGSKWRFAPKALSRTAMLVFLGCLVDSSIAKTPVLGLGVLQLIGLAYGVAAFCYSVPRFWRGLLAAGLLTGYWAAMKFIAVPGAGTGIASESINLVNWVNQTYLQPIHLAGLLSVVPTTAMVLFGTLVGDMLRGESNSRLRNGFCLIGIGAAMAVAGWLWSLDLPFNKALWTSSYIVYTAGLGMVVLGVFYMVIDLAGWRSWSFPLVVFGMNAIAAYVVPVLVKVQVLQAWHVGTGAGVMTLKDAFLHLCTASAGRVGGGWLYTITYILAWWLVLAWMHHRKLFLKV